MPSRNVTMGGTRWVTPGSRPQTSDGAAKLQSGSPPGHAALQSLFAFFRVLLRLFLFELPSIPFPSDTGIRLA
jgi:hypothetical protein